MKKYIGYFVTCFLLVEMAGVEMSYAYYDTEKNNESSFFQMERYHAKSIMGEQVFVFYDNANTLSMHTIPGRIVNSPSKEFVPADVIHCNIPIHIAIRGSITPDNSLSNLLYADLRLKRIYAEYASLQQRANSVLAGLSIPFIEGGMVFGYSQGAGQSIHTRREALQGGYRVVAARFSGKSGDVSSLLSTESMTPLIEPQQSGEWVALRDLSGFRELETAGGGNSSNPQSLVENTEKVQSNIAQQRSESPTGGGNANIPWIIRLFMAIQDYMFSNPRDVIVIMLGIALVSSFILSAVRRK